VAGGSTYVLKIAAANAECRGFCDADATRGMLEMENDAMGLIAQAGVSVPEPLPAKDGSKIVRLEQLGGACEETGACFVRLITFLGGTLLAEVPE
jgi:Ser/Thr protein kinase RdoA (MazF antagonist)